MLYGPLVISRWDRSVQAISRVEGLAALLNPIYLQDRWLYTVSGIGLMAILAFMSVISTLKPWTKQDQLKLRPGPKSKPAKAEAGQSGAALALEEATS